MKIKNYLFRFAAAFTAFILGVSFLNAWQNSETIAQTNNPEVVAVQPITPQETIVMPSLVAEIPNAEMPITETTSATDLNENVEYEFDAAGDYYIIGDLAKNFTEVEQISIATHDYANASEKNNYQGIPIPPAGSVWTKKEYKFARINIANRQIAFETETRKGTSYKFVGKFIDNIQGNEEEYADLEGRLIKMRNGKKIAEGKIRLVLMSGC